MNEDRNTRISKEQFNSLMKEIKAMAREMGVKLTIYKRPINWNRYGCGFPNFGELRGYYSVEQRRIVVTFYGTVGRAKLLNVILHELRHAIHHREGLYADYYDDLWDRLDDYIEEGHTRRPCKRTAYLAEMDCNRFAYYWLRKKGINIKKCFKYPYFSTRAYVFEQMLEQRLQELNK